MKRCQSEDRSRFIRELPCLNSRYVLLSMLGRGGFSEVWKALDLVELREVAVKVSEIYEGEERIRGKMREDDSTEEKKTKRNVMKGTTRDI